MVKLSALAFESVVLFVSDFLLDIKMAEFEASSEINTSSKIETDKQENDRKEGK